MVKTADSKGRIGLGAAFANRNVIIERVDDTEVRVILAEVVPAREAWLHKNPAAMDSVIRGLEQAKLMQLSENPIDIDKLCPPDHEDD